MEDLGRVASTLVRNSLAPASQKTYRKVFDDFVLFVISIDSNFKKLPASNDHMLKYISRLFTQKVSYATMASKVSMISYYHKIASVLDPALSIIVKKSMRGYQRLSPSQKSKIPLSSEDVESMFKTIDMLVLPVYHSAMLKSILSLGFFALLRPGEITKSANMLEFGDISIHDNFINLSFSRFKHAKSTPTEITIVKQCNTICPYENLVNYIELRSYEKGPLFCLPGMQPISYKRLQNWLKLLVSASSLDEKTSLHSLRVGGATYYALQGHSDNYIQRFGRWSGRAFDSYIKFHCINIKNG